MKIEVKSIKIDLLEPNKGQIKGLPKNPRIIKDERYRKLIKSIEDSPEFLNLRELIVFKHGDKFVVIAGNQRLSACKELKFEEMPCKVLPENTSIEKLKEYTIKDNVSFGEMDWEEIEINWDSSEITSWGEEMQTWKPNEIEYSTKNKEIDINTIEGLHTIKITFSKKDWDKIKSKVQKSNKTNEEIFYSAAIQL